MNEEKDKKDKKNVLGKSVSFGGVKLREKAVFIKNLAIMLNSGLSITDSLDVLLSQTTGKLQKIIESIGRSVASGNSLSSSFSKFPKIFSSFFINTVKAGEASGNLENNLNNLADHLTKERELISKIRGAMLYPLIVLILSFVLGITLAFLVLPKITPIFVGLKIDLPASTRFLIWFSELIENHGVILLSVFVILLVFLSWFLKQRIVRPITHFLLLHLPIIGKISRKKNLVQFTSTLGTLLKSGLSIDEVLKVSKKTVRNYYYQKSIEKIRSSINQGRKLSDSLEEFSNIYPKMVISMIRVGEKSGKLEEESFNLAKIYKSEVEAAADNLTTVIEPILLIVIGVVVGGLALSIITPIYKITGNVYR